jgi:3-hydroxypropanoate dehydrogenase
MESRIFTEARTPGAFRPDPLPAQILQKLYELLKWAPTSANSFPLRIVFAISEEARNRLADCAPERNAVKIRQAPATAILGYDLRFFERMPELFPHNPAMPAMFAKDPELAATTAFRNGSLQGGYFIVAARMLGLDCGPMSGFDNAAVDAAFFPHGRVRSNFICALGFADPAAQRPRLPRPAFAEACAIL